MKRTLFSILWLLGCGSPPQSISVPSPLPSSAPPVRPAIAHADPAVVTSGQCENVGPSPFRKTDAAHIIIADFYGVRKEDRQFGEDVAEQVDSELTRLKEEVLPQLKVHIPLDDIEFQRLHCFVKSHGQAEEIAKAWNADLIVWGKAYCNVRSRRQQTVNITQSINTRTVTAGGDINIGNIKVEESKAYTVCPNATLVRSGTKLRRSSGDNPIDISSLGHLNLPTLSSKSPFALVEFTLGLHFYERAQPWIAARLFERSAKAVLSPEDENLSTLHMYLGRAYLALPGGEDKSIEYSQKALEALNDDEIARSTLLNNIGTAFESKGDYDKALSYFQRALAVDEKVLGKNDPVMATHLNNLGMALARQGKFSESLTHLERALDIDENALGKNHPTVAVDLNNIGAAYWNLGDYSKAMARFQRALPLIEEELGKDHPDVAVNLNNIGMALLTQGRREEALTYFRRALAIDVKALGKDHRLVAVRLNNIGGALGELGKYDEALPQYRRALEIEKNALGESHPSVATSYNNIGNALDSLGKHEEALTYFSQALRIHQQAFGDEHPTVAIDQNNIGMALRAQGKLTEAVVSLRRALAISEKAFEPDHPEVGKSLYSLASTLSLQGKCKEALPLFRRAVQILKSKLGAKHPNTIAASDNMAECMR